MTCRTFFFLEFICDIFCPPPVELHNHQVLRTKAAPLHTAHTQYWNQFSTERSCEGTRRGVGDVGGGRGSCLQRDFISISGAYINSPRTRNPGNNALQRLWEPRYELRLCQLHQQKHKDASWTSISAALGAKRSPRTERSWCVNVKRSINPSVSPVVSHQNDGSCSPAQIQSFIGHKLLVAEFGSLSRASSLI